MTFTKISLTFFIKKNVKYRQKSHFWTLNLNYLGNLTFFGWNFLACGFARTRFQRTKIYKNT